VQTSLLYFLFPLLPFYYTSAFDCVCDDYVDVIHEGKPASVVHNEAKR